MNHQTDPVACAPYRNLFQLYHVHGGFVGRLDRADPQLPPPKR